MGHGANVFAAAHQVGELDEIFPAIAEAFTVDRDLGIRPGREIEGKMDSTAPGSGGGEFAIKELFDALGGDCEKCGIKDDESRVGPEISCGFGRASAAGVMDEELAGDAASESAVLGVAPMSNEQEAAE